MVLGAVNAILTPGVDYSCFGILVTSLVHLSEARHGTFSSERVFGWEFLFFLMALFVPRHPLLSLCLVVVFIR